MSGSFYWSDYIATLKTVLAGMGLRLQTIMPVYINETGLGGYGIIFGNVFGMILAHLLLITVALLSVIGLITVLRWLFTRKKKMDPHEKWLKTGKM